MTAPEPLVPGIYLLVEPLDGRRLTVAVVVGEDGVTLVDTGLAGTPRRLVVPALAALGLEASEIRQVVVTHSDIDHSGGLGEIRTLAPAAVAIAHRLDIPWIEDVELLIEERYRGLRDEHGLDADQVFLDWVRRSDSGARIDIGVVGGETLRLEKGRALELIHLPGHSRGHLGALDHVTGTALIGDAVFGGVTPLLDGSGAFGPGYYDVAAYRATIARLSGLDLKRLVGTHYPVFEGPAVAEFLRESERFCDRLEGAVLTALAGRPALPTRELVAAAAPAVRAWPPEADIGIAVAVVAHLRDLRARGLVQSVAGSPVRWAAA